MTASLALAKQPQPVPAAPCPAQVADAARANRVLRGRRNYQTGLLAEEAVQRHYRQSGAELVDSRWRGAGAEIDLIFRQGDQWLFAEVKAGRDFDTAAARIRWDQVHRICRAAEAYAGPGALMRIDAALVDGIGRVQVIENISMPG